MKGCKEDEVESEGWGDGRGLIGRAAGKEEEGRPCVESGGRGEMAISLRQLRPNKSPRHSRPPLACFGPPTTLGAHNHLLVRGGPASTLLNHQSAGGDKRPSSAQRVKRVAPPRGHESAHFPSSPLPPFGGHSASRGQDRGAVAVHEAAPAEVSKVRVGVPTQLPELVRLT